MTDDHDSDPAVRLMRKASALLDEQPSAAVRARVLQAAASQRPPQRAKATGVPMRGLAIGRWFGAPWLAGAATLGVVAVLGLGIVLRVEQGNEPQSTRIETAANSAPAAAQSSQPRNPTTLSRPQASARDTAPGSLAVARSSREERVGELGPRRESAPAAVTAPNSAEFTERQLPPDRIGPAQESSSASDAAQPRENARLASAAKSAPDVGAVAAGSQPASSPPLPPQAQSNRSVMASGSAAPGAIARSDPTPYRASARSWLEQIRVLRKAGRDEQADKELRLFREAYPDFVLPEDVRRP